jgi:hypothetical protein
MAGRTHGSRCSDGHVDLRQVAEGKDHPLGNIDNLLSAPASIDTPRNPNMPISPDAARQGQRYTLATPLSGKLRPRRDRSDFGGVDSYRLKVRRLGRDYPFGNDIRDGDFGVFLGPHEGSYLVALQSLLSAGIVGLERYPTLADLKQHWELD